MKNLSRISVRMRSKSIRLSAKDRLRFPFSNREETHSILDDFPMPPSYIPTPSDAGGYKWPPLAEPLIEKEVSPSVEVSRERQDSSGPFKTLTRALTRLGRHSSAKAEPVVAGSTTIIVRPPRPSRAPPSLPVEEQKTYLVVDPLALTASPPPLLGADLSVSARNSFVPPSPSWLSRNLPPAVQRRISVEESEVAPTPSSPSPLPIPPRILVSECPDTQLLSPLETTAGWLEYPEVPTDVRQSFISIMNAARNERQTPVRF
ncbi:hypothetical protein BDP27DRAFT_880443 [Rhodocollybia butyracea]|uniref:Uncharacterized protein n=1 Tax=Rhodocollybia butyracea TaxID=206335 RepID=A0A9P5UEC0_9AGAR|nr:hypothetical protein BDP27DRAFT_880443 [Rhodocollybia butyracea]